MKNISNHKQNLIPALIIVVGTVVSYLVFGPHKIHSQTDQTTASEKPAAKVRTIILGEGRASNAKLEKTAVFNSATNSQAIAQYSGVVSTVSFNVGDYVNEGQVLAVFDQSNNENSPKVALDSAKNNLALALQNLEYTEESSENSIDLAKRNLKNAKDIEDQAEDSDDKDAEENAKNARKIAEIQVEQAKDSADKNINMAETQLSQARSAVEQARISYENTIIKAPISGLVASKSISESEYVISGDAIGEIVGSGKLEATISLNGSQINRVRIGDEVSIVMDNEEVVGGEIVSLSPVANSSNGRFDVKVQTLENYSGQANRPGTVALELSLDQTTPDRFFVPLEAVSIGQTKTIVFVVVDGRAVSRDVVLGDVIGTQVEVRQGLSAGDEVVVENSRNLQEGQKVQDESK